MLCRLCLHECIDNNGVKLFENTEETPLAKLIAKYLYLEVTQSDTFSTILCKECLQHLNDFHKFFQHIEQRQKELNDNFLEIKLVVGQTANILDEDQVVDNLFHVETNEESLLDIKDVLAEEQNAEMETFLPKEEFGYAILEDNVVDTDNSSNNDDEDLPLQNLLVKAKIKKGNRQKRLNTSKKSRCMKIAVKKKNRGKTKKVSNKSKTSNEVSTQKEEEEKAIEGLIKESRDTSANDDDKLRDELIAKHMQLKCEICEIIVETYKDLSSHFRKVHNRRAFITCCGMRFRRRFLLADHIQTHLDPDHFKCKVCGKLLKSRVCLEVHKSNKHSDRQQQKHACKLCHMRFKYLSMLNRHMISHIKRRTHICEVCKKTFKNIGGLEAHIKHMHGERTPFICDFCGKEYRFKLSFDRHVAEHQGIPSENKKCPICGKWVSPNNINRHISSHEIENNNCEVCGKTSKSKAALKSHIRYSHGTKQIYPCTFCNKTFERPRYLKEHIDMHTGQKDYLCSYCPREFRSKSNMYAHVKKAHFEQWTHSHLARVQGPISQKVNQIETKVNSPFE